MKQVEIKTIYCSGVFALKKIYYKTKDGTIKKIISYPNKNKKVSLEELQDFYRGLSNEKY